MPYASITCLLSLSLPVIVLELERVNMIHFHSDKIARSCFPDTSSFATMTNNNNNTNAKARRSTKKQSSMTDSWIVVDEEDFVVVDPYAIGDERQPVSTLPSQPAKQTMNKKRKWKMLYSLASSNGIQGNVDQANLDSYVIDQHAQLYEKRDFFRPEQGFVRVK